MAQVLPLRPHTFRLDNIIIDTYAAEMGAIGVAIYAVLQRYADRRTGQCWPSVATIAKLLDLSKNCVKKYLHRLVRLGLLRSTPRYTAEGDPTSNLYTLPDPMQPAAVQGRRQGGGAAGAGGGAPGALPPQPSAHGVPEGGASHGSDQDPPQQLLTSDTATTSLALPETQPQPQPARPTLCTHPGHRHWSPTPDLWICNECYCCWVPAAEATSPTRAPEAPTAPLPPPAASEEPKPGPHASGDVCHRAMEPPLAQRA
jgi:Helix-turn-helix domain